MWKKFILVLCVFAVSACQTSGSGYSRSTYNQKAEQPPSPLNSTATIQSENLLEKSIVGEGDATYADNGEFDVAGLEYTPRNGQNGYQSNRSSQSSERPVTLPAVKVALLVPLSGEHKGLGQAMLQAAQLALFDMDYTNFEIMPRDTKGDPKTARAAAESALQDGAELIIGPLFSASVKSVKSVAARYNKNVVAFSTDWSLGGGNTFIMGFLPFAQVERVTEYAVRQGYQNIGILAPNTDYGNAVVSAYNSISYRNGVNRAHVARFEAESSDVSNVIRAFTKHDDRIETLNQKVRALEGQIERNPNDRTAKSELAQLNNMKTWGDAPYDAIMLPVGGEQLRSIANLLNYYDLDTNKVKILGTGLWDDEGLATEKNLNGAWYAAPSVELRRGFENNFRQTYGYSAPRLATLAYDATALAIVLAKSGNQQYGKPLFDRRSISNPNGFAGVDGIFRFRPDGLVERGLAVMEIRDGSARIIDSSPRTFQKPRSF